MSYSQSAKQYASAFHMLVKSLNYIVIGNPLLLPCGSYVRPYIN